MAKKKSIKRKIRKKREMDLWVKVGLVLALIFIVLIMLFGMRGGFVEEEGGLATLVNFLDFGWLVPGGVVGDGYGISCTSNSECAELWNCLDGKVTHCNTEKGECDCMEPTCISRGDEYRVCVTGQKCVGESIWETRSTVIDSVSICCKGKCVDENAKTCSEQGGKICNVEIGELCESGEIIGSSDSDYCCKGECSNPLSTCSGDICEEDEKCPGNIVGASDTDKCCDEECVEDGSLGDCLIRGGDRFCKGECNRIDAICIESLDNEGDKEGVCVCDPLFGKRDILCSTNSKCEKEIGSDCGEGVAYCDTGGSKVCKCTIPGDGKCEKGENFKNSEGDCGSEFVSCSEDFKCKDYLCGFKSDRSRVSDEYYCGDDGFCDCGRCGNDRCDFGETYDSCFKDCSEGIVISCIPGKNQCPKGSDCVGGFCIKSNCKGNEECPIRGEICNTNTGDCESALDADYLEEECLDKGSDNGKKYCEVNCKTPNAECVELGKEGSNCDCTGSVEEENLLTDFRSFMKSFEVEEGPCPIYTSVEGKDVCLIKGDETPTEILLAGVEGGCSAAVSTPAMAAGLSLITGYAFKGYDSSTCETCKLYSSNYNDLDPSFLVGEKYKVTKIGQKRRINGKWMEIWGLTEATDDDKKDKVPDYSKVRVVSTKYDNSFSLHYTYWNQRYLS